MLVTLLMLIGILYAAYRVSKYIGTTTIRQSQSKYIKIIDMMAVGQDKAISITQVGQKIFLVGITSGGMTTLAELTPEDMQELEKSVIERPDVKNKFADILKKVKNKSQ
ncbi:MAG: flagellar biosynthetic protein FliO [Proteocatella sp.]